MTEDRRMERALELLAVRATEPLDAVEAAELEALLGALPAVDRGELDLVAAELAVAAAEATGDAGEPLPASLRARLLDDADAFFEARERARGPEASVPLPPPRLAARPGPRRAPSTAAAWGGWALAAAAALALAWLGTRPPELVEVPVEVPVPVEPTPPTAPPTPTEARADFLATHPEASVLAWSAGPDATGAGASGDVVWSDDAQRGFMRFSGLAPNDPAEAQYQLWIFDANRDEAHPVDGGVFDVPEGADEVVIPIDAKLPVDRATLFAVTVERPGGVVVSSRERIAALAKPAAS